jgi:hypothetical protein
VSKRGRWAASALEHCGVCRVDRPPQTTPHQEPARPRPRSLPTTSSSRCLRRPARRVAYIQESQPTYLHGEKDWQGRMTLQRGVRIEVLMDVVLRFPFFHFFFLLIHLFFQLRLLQWTKSQAPGENVESAA